MRACPATADDIPAIRSLLIAAALPVDGIEAAFRTGVVLRGDTGALTAAAAIEPYGDVGLLRSVVVDVDARGRGAGRRIVAEGEALARSLGMNELFILTETAADVFTRLGYRPVERASVPAAIRASAEFASLCGETATAMARRLDRSPGRGSGLEGRESREGDRHEQPEAGHGSDDDR